MTEGHYGKVPILRVLRREAEPGPGAAFAGETNPETGPLPGRWDALAVLLCAFILFAGTLGHGLVWDDPRFIKYAEEVVTDEGLPAILTSEYRPDVSGGPSTGYHRPLALASLWLDRQVGSGGPVAFHLTNVLLHTLASLLVLLLFRRLLASRAGALGGALLFALHPVHVESVAFVSGRTDVLAGVFCLLTVILWLRVPGGRPRRPLLELGLSLLTFTAACLSKEIALVLPVVLVTWSALSFPGNPSGSETGRRAMVIWSMLFFCVVAMLVLWRYFVLDIEFGRGLVPKTEGTHGLHTIPRNLLLYFRLLILPLSLRPFYWTRGLGVGPADALAVLLLAGLILGFAFRDNPRIAGAATTWMLVFILPVSGIVPVHGSPLAERYLYLPSVGFCLLAGRLWGRFYESRLARAATVVPGVAVLLVFALGAWSYSANWRDDVTLYSEMIMKEPEAVLGYFNLGNTFRSTGRLEGAEWAYREAINVEPRFAGGHINLMGLYLAMGRCEEAAGTYEGALKASDGDPDDLYGLIRILAQFGLEEAAEEPIGMLRDMDRVRTDKVLSISSREAVIDSACSRAGWPPPP